MSDVPICQERRDEHVQFGMMDSDWITHQCWLPVGHEGPHWGLIYLPYTHMYEPRAWSTPAPIQPASEWEFATTTGPRKAWDNLDEPPAGEGWELDPTRGLPGESWERFDYHEERYWRRRTSANNHPTGDAS